VRVDDPYILAEVYRIYGSRHLQKDISVDLESLKGLLKALGGEAADASPTAFVDTSLLEQLEREGFFQKTTR
jgi:hypothetical protein